MSIGLSSLFHIVTLAKFSLLPGLDSWIRDLNQYEPILYFDWDTFIDLMAKEPLALTAVLIAFFNILFTILFKMWDHNKEAKKEAQQRAVLHIEIHPNRNRLSKQVESLQVVLTNTGKEPLVIRDVGYQKRSLQRRLFSYLSPIQLKAQYHPFDRSLLLSDLPEARWPVSIYPREFFEFSIQGESLDALKKATHHFTVRDSLGNLWLYRGASISRFAQQYRSEQKQPDSTPNRKTNVTIKNKVSKSHQELSNKRSKKSVDLSSTTDMITMGVATHHTHQHSAHQAPNSDLEETFIHELEPFEKISADTVTHVSAHASAKE